MKKRLPQAILLILIALTATSLGYWVSRKKNSVPTPLSSIGLTDSVIARLMNTPFATTEGQWQSLSAWRGKILVVNFWATWCPPCREEMPMFSALQTQYKNKNVQFVGISIDQIDKVRKYQATEKIAYPLLIGSPDAMNLSADLGNAAQALPFTAIIAPTGKLGFVKTGVLTKVELEDQLRRLAAQ